MMRMWCIPVDRHQKGGCSTVPRVDDWLGRHDETEIHTGFLLLSAYSSLIVIIGVYWRYLCVLIGSRGVRGVETWLVGWSVSSRLGFVYQSIPRRRADVFIYFLFMVVYFALYCRIRPREKASRVCTSAIVTTQSTESNHRLT